ncbi:MAG: hypothetical protein ACR2G7_09150 [Acidimicrobiales bacterium]
MVAVFVRLKLRLLRNGLRLGWQQKVGLVVGAVYAVPLALGGFAVLAVGRGNPSLGRSATTLMFLLPSWAGSSPPCSASGPTRPLTPPGWPCSHSVAVGWRPASSPPPVWGSAPLPRL